MNTCVQHVLYYILQYRNERTSTHAHIQQRTTMKCILIMALSIIYLRQELHIDTLHCVIGTQGVPEP